MSVNKVTCTQCNKEVDLPTLFNLVKSNVDNYICPNCYCLINIDYNIYQEINSLFNYPLLDYENNEDRADIVIWSGGCDSTLLLFEMAMKHKLENNNKKVLAVSFNRDTVIQNENDIKAREKLKNVFENYKLPIEYLTISYKFMNLNDWEINEGELSRGIYLDGCTPNVNYYNNNGLAQPMAWLSGLQYLMLYKANFYFGYIKGDCLWHYKTEFINAFNSLTSLVQSDCSLKFPYEWYSKKDIAYKLQEYDLLDYVGYCKSKGDSPCGACDKCKEINFIKENYLKDTTDLKKEDYINE